MARKSKSRETESEKPSARPASEFIVQSLEKETILYDIKNHKAHCLAAPAAYVWSLCDGRRDLVEITSSTKTKFGKAEAENVAATIEQLARAELLAAAPKSKRINRRALLTGLAAAAAVTTVFVPKRSAHASVQCPNLNGTCTSREGQGCTLNNHGPCDGHCVNENGTTVCTL